MVLRDASSGSRDLCWSTGAACRIHGGQPPMAGRSHSRGTRSSYSARRHAQSSYFRTLFRLRTPTTLRPVFDIASEKAARPICLCCSSRSSCSRSAWRSRFASRPPLQQDRSILVTKALDCIMLKATDDPAIAAQKIPGKIIGRDSRETCISCSSILVFYPVSIAKSIFSSFFTFTAPPVALTG
jgi:hypothetical protein